MLVLRQSQGQGDTSNMQRKQNGDLQEKRSSSFESSPTKTSEHTAEADYTVYMSEVLFICNCTSN